MRVWIVLLRRSTKISVSVLLESIALFVGTRVDRGRSREMGWTGCLHGASYSMPWPD